MIIPFSHDHAWKKGGSPTIPLEMTANFVILNGTFVLFARKFCQLYIAILKKKKKILLVIFGSLVQLPENLLPNSYTLSQRESEARPTSFALWRDLLRNMQRWSLSTRRMDRLYRKLPCHRLHPFLSFPISKPGTCRTCGNGREFLQLSHYFNQTQWQRRIYTAI